jgi:hypothetical protein
VSSSCPRRVWPGFGRLLRERVALRRNGGRKPEHMPSRLIAVRTASSFLFRRKIQEGSYRNALGWGGKPTFCRNFTPRAIKIAVLQPRYLRALKFITSTVRSSWLPLIIGCGRQAKPHTFRASPACRRNYAFNFPADESAFKCSMFRAMFTDGILPNSSRSALLLDGNHCHRLGLQLQL